MTVHERKIAVPHAEAIARGSLQLPESVWKTTTAAYAFRLVPVAAFKSGHPESALRQQRSNTSGTARMLPSAIAIHSTVSAAPRDARDASAFEKASRRMPTRGTKMRSRADAAKSSSADADAAPRHAVCERGRSDAGAVHGSRTLAQAAHCATAAAPKTLTFAARKDACAAARRRGGMRVPSTSATPKTAFDSPRFTNASRDSGGVESEKSCCTRQAAACWRIATPRAPFHGRAGAWQCRPTTR